MIRLFYLYQWCSRVHPLDEPEHIFLSGGGKPSYSTQQFQGQVVWGLWCCTVLLQDSTEKNRLAKKIAVATSGYIP